MMAKIVMFAKSSSVYPSEVFHALFTNSKVPSGRTLWIMCDAFSMTAW